MKRIYKDDVPQHVCNKGINGQVIYYTNADCICFLTLYYCLAQEYGIVTSAFSLMPNHFHAQQWASCLRNFLAFNQQIKSRFMAEYNVGHNRSGALFESPFVSFPKSVAKLVKANISYICNNAFAGKIAKGLTDYRWNLLAYYNNPHPFSEPIVRSKASAAMRRALAIVDDAFEHLQPLNYAVQKRINKKLNPKERAQILDYIISKYNILDYDKMLSFFDSYEYALKAMSTSQGSEHDMKEDWDDYSVYKEMSRILIRCGFSDFNIDAMSQETKQMLRHEIYNLTNATSRQIEKYLHL